MPDTFGTEALRSSVLRAWEDSPTRFTEDSNAEHDLRVGGYRDRLFVELAQNAADAAALAGKPGTLRLSVVDGELRVANTGAPLDAAGVASLSSLRASAKRDGTVGRFGVGFAAVLAVSSEPRVVSRTGGVVFSETRTREVSGRTGDVPILRLPWPVSEDEPPPPEGFDTEVRLPLRVDVDLEAFAAEAEDLLLALPWIARIEIGESSWTRTDVGDGVVEIGARRWRIAGPWALPVDREGRPEPLESDVLHAPTPTDERLSLPAMLIAPVPIEPSRRRVLPGEGVRAALTEAASGYPDLVRALPVEHRLALVPRPRFPLSEVDSTVRELVLERLTADPWLPLAGGGEVAAGRARVLDVDAPDVVKLVADLVPGLLSLCGPETARVLAPLGAETLGMPAVVEALTGIERAPGWWRSLYAALLPLLEAHSVRADDLGGLPVPLADGRTLPGPRGVLLMGGPAELVEMLSTVDVSGLRVVHPDATHPLLERLGAKEAGPGDLLESPALRDAVDRSMEDASSGLDTRPLAEAVLRLVSETRSAEGLGALALPAEHGWRRADELLLPDSPLLEILDVEAFGEDGALDVLDEDFAARWPDDVLTALGVLGTFTVVVDDEPVEPEHDLPDEEQWWSSSEEPPSRVLAVRELDLVAEDAWPEALRLLASRPETWRALTLPGGHTGWWIARYGALAGRPPTEWRLPSATGLAGLFDPVPEEDEVRPDVLAAIGVRSELVVENADDVTDLLGRLADPGRSIPAGLVLRTHTALADSAVDADPPERVRALDGSVVDAEDAVVLDAPWLLAVWPPNRLVAAEPGEERAHRLAALLDLPLAGERTAARVGDDGEFVAWSELTAVVLAAELLGISVPDGGVVVHERLTVTTDRDYDVQWWSADALHAEDSSGGLARAFAWATDHWSARHHLAVLLDDPDPVVLLAK